MVSSPDGRYLAIIAPQSVRLYGVSNGSPSAPVVLAVATPTPSPSPTPGPSATPVVSISVSPTSATEGAIVTFQISASPNTARPVSVFYSMSGTALKGADYTLDPASDPTYPRLTIPVGSDSGIIAMTILVDHVREGNETATMTLQSGPYYSFAPAAGKKKKKAKAPSATVTLIDGP